MLSIIIVNYNTKAYIEKCIHSIVTNIKKISYELIIIDNNSHDGSADMIKTSFLDVKLIQNKMNIGFAAANNQGYRISKGEYFLLLNPDTVVLPGAIEEMLSFIEDHPDGGIVAPMLLNEDKTLQRSCRDFPGIWFDIFKGFGFHKFFPRHPLLGNIRTAGWDHDSIQEVNQPQGACLLVRKDALTGNRVFDERFFMYYEEVDLCYRIKKKKWRIFFLPNAKVIHFSGKSFSKTMPRMIFHMYRSKFLFYKKHYNIIQQNILYLFIPIEMAFRVISYALIGLFSGKRREEACLRIRGYSKVFSRFIMGKLAKI